MNQNQNQNQNQKQKRFICVSGGKDNESGTVFLLDSYRLMRHMDSTSDSYVYLLSCFLRHGANVFMILFLSLAYADFLRSLSITGSVGECARDDTLSYSHVTMIPSIMD